jgi:hypothetical protein
MSNRKITDMTFDDWVKIGFDNGWVGAPICETHDGLPLTEAQDKEFEEGGDPCVHILRLYDTVEEKLEVEENHSPSIWRATNSGLGISNLE